LVHNVALRAQEDLDLFADQIEAAAAGEPGQRVC